MPLPQTNLIAQFTAKAGLTEISNELDQWTSQVNSSDVLVAASSTARPSMVQDTINGVDCPLFDGVSDFMQESAWNQGTTSSNIVTVGAVLKAPTGQDNFSYCWDGGDGFNDNAMYFNGSDIVMRTGGDGGSVTFSNDTVIRLIFKYRHNSFGTSQMYVDGVLENSPAIARSSANGLTLGGRQDQSNFGEFTLAELVYYDGDVDVGDLDQYFQDEWIDAGDQTAPTFTTNGDLTSANVAATSLDITFDKAQDETSAQAALVYKLYRADSGADISDLAGIDANGTEVDSGTDVTTLSDSALTNGTTYEYNVTAEDEAGNRIAYTQEQVTTLTNITGTVTLNGSPVEDASVEIRTVDDFAFGNASLVEVATTDANGVYEMATAYSASNHYEVTVKYFDILESGTAESGGASTLTDTDKSFTVSEFNDFTYVIRLTGGTGSGQERVISDNTATEITVKDPWSVTPDATTTYEIGKLYSGISKTHIAQN